MHILIWFLFLVGLFIYTASYFITLEIVDASNNVLKQKQEQENSNQLQKAIQNARLRMGNDDGKLQQWVEIAEKVPKDITKPKKPSITEASMILDNTIYKQDKAKKHILGIIAKHITNPGSLHGSVLGFKGNQGLGKTTLAKHGLSSAIGLPFSSIPLGGSSKQGDDLLKGHAYSYVGSHCGMVLNAIIESGSLNPIVFFDELDKCDESAQNALINITDPEHSYSFTDRYLGFPIDISKSIIIFAFNSKENVNPILRDRMTEIHFDEYSEEDKKEITNRYTIDKMKKRYNLHLNVSSDAVNSIVKGLNPNDSSIRRTEESLDKTVSMKLIDILKKKNDNDDSVSSLDITKNDVSFPEDTDTTHLHMFS